MSEPSCNGGPDGGGGVQAAVLRKKAAHAGMDNLVNMENRPMILIGG